MSRLAGLLTLKKASRGPALDRGEVQRYLSSLMLCPAALVNHASLEWTAVAESVLRVRDTADRTGAAVDLEIGIDGEPTSCHTIRPRLMGRNAVDTEWEGKGRDFRLWNGMRMAHRTRSIVGDPGRAVLLLAERSDALRTGSLIDA